MNKTEQIALIKKLFKSEVNFFKWIGLKNPSQSWYSYKNRGYASQFITKLLTEYDNRIRREKTTKGFIE